MSVTAQILRRAGQMSSLSSCRSHWERKLFRNRDVQAQSTDSFFFEGDKVLIAGSGTPFRATTCKLGFLEPCSLILAHNVLPVQNSYPSSRRNYGIYLPLFEIGANSNEQMRFICQKSTAKRTRWIWDEVDTCHHIGGCCAWVDGGAPFGFKILISLFFQTINVF